MKRHFRCFIAEITKHTGYSYADVVGVRDIGGDLSGDVETIIVEVKRGLEPFATASGQTLGYNISANRVYMADIRGKMFTQDELQIASHLGIGLIQISHKKCREVLSSPFYNPIRRFNLALLENLGLGLCQLCGSLSQIGTPEKLHSNLVNEDVKKALDDWKGLKFYDEEISKRKDKLGIGPHPLGKVYDRRFICSNCVGELLSVQEKRIRGWIRDYSPKRGG
ncbi:MAG: hypothetical protein ABSF45_01900 [Terriglobia bacterium]